MLDPLLFVIGLFVPAIVAGATVAIGLMETDDES